MSFHGTKRFELIRKLGEGGMGLVYEAHDNERQMRVALKTLRDIGASSLYRFKREFRALTDISHPNIVGFYELVSGGNDWFFTMELVQGTDFMRWVRPAGWVSSTEMALLDTADRTALTHRRAERRSDIYARSLFRTQPSAWRRLLEDQPDLAQREVESALEGWPREPFYVIHYMELAARMIVLLYRGQTRAALDEITRMWPELRRAGITQLPRIIADLNVRKLRASFSEKDDSSLKAALKGMEKLRAAPGDAYVALYRGALAFRDGRSDEAQQQLVSSLRLFEEAEMWPLAAATRFRLGQLLGGDEGQRMADTALTWFGGQGCRAPTKMIDLLAPEMA